MFARSYWPGAYWPVAYWPQGAEAEIPAEVPDQGGGGPDKSDEDYRKAFVRRAKHLYGEPEIPESEPVQVESRDEAKPESPKPRAPRARIVELVPDPPKVITRAALEEEIAIVDEALAVDQEAASRAALLLRRRRAAAMMLILAAASA